MPDTRILNKYFLFIISFFVIYCLFLSSSFWFQNVDDAYISFRYGKNLMNGNGLVYNQGEYVEGYTNFLWTIITSPFTLIKFIDISFFTLVLGLLISLFNVYLLILITRIYLSGFKVQKILFYLPALFFVLDDSIAFWAIGGMEFPLYTMFILSALYFYLHINRRFRDTIFLAIFLMLITLTRPEGNMIYAITIFHMLLNPKSVNEFKKKLISLLLLYSVFIIFYYGFKLFYYGQIIPNTFYAKGVTDFGMNLYLGSKYLTLCLGSRIYIFGFIAFIPFKKIIRIPRESFLILLSVVYIIYLVIVGGDWMFANRFFVPIIPLLYILSAVGFVFAVERFKNIRFKNYSIGSLINTIAIILSVLLFSITLTFLEYKQLIIKDENYKYEMQWSKFGQWLKNNVSPNTIIAVGPAGKIPYYSELYTIDMWGLNNDFIAKTRSKRIQAGHKKFDFDYVLSLKPEFIIGYAGFNDSDIPPQFEKFNAPEEEYKSIDIVFRLKKEFRTTNK